MFEKLENVFVAQAKTKIAKILHFGYKMVRVVFKKFTAFYFTSAMGKN